MQFGVAACLDGATVGVRAIGEFDGEFLAKTTGDFDTHERCKASQLRRHQDLHVFGEPVLAVWVEVLALDVGVDRHLCDFASTNRLDEVDGHDATLLLQQGLRWFGDFDLHDAESNPVT